MRRSGIALRLSLAVLLTPLFAIAVPVTAQDGPSGQIVFATRISELETLHPFTARLARAQAVAYHVNEGLTKFAPDFSIVPGLAESWDISDDNLTYTFQLRQGVTWHDGEPFTAADVQFTFDAAAAEDSQSAAKATLDTYVASVEAPDEATIVITLSQPYSPLLSALADQLTILPAHLLEGNVYDPDFSLLPVGTGPYRVTEHEIDFVQLEANTDYWGDVARTETVILRDAPEPAAQTAGLLAGDLDVVAFVPTAMANLEAQGLPIFSAPAGSIHGINLDLQNPLLQDPLVRQALLLGLDRERIRGLHYAGGTLANAVVSPAYEEYHATEVTEVSRDVEAANALLDEAGWVMNDDSGVREREGEPFQIDFYAWTGQQWQDIATIAQASWAELGIEVEIVVTENALIADTLSGTYDTSAIGWGLTSDPIVGLNLLFHTTDQTFAEGSTRNVFRYSNPDVDAMLEAALTTADPAERADLAKQIQTVIADEVPFIPIAYPAYELIAQPNISLDETGEGTLSGVGVGWFMNLWTVEA